MSRVETVAAALSQADAVEAAGTRAAGELRSVRGADALLAVYGWLRGPGAARGRRAILRLLGRLEGGERQGRHHGDHEQPQPVEPGRLGEQLPHQPAPRRRSRRASSTEP